VIAEAVRRSPLAGFAEPFASAFEATGQAVAIREIPFVTQINLRVDPKDTELLRRLQPALGFDLPLTPNTTAEGGDRRVLWLGPDEWLLVAPQGQAASLERDMRDAFAGAFGSIADVSANRTVLEVAGPGAVDLLAQGIPIDLYPRAFRAGQCAQTLLAKAQVIIERRGDQPSFHLYVRASFAGYVADWLLEGTGISVARSGR
jgi:sarcosine oxidase subunit gamma